MTDPNKEPKNEPPFRVSPSSLSPIVGSDSCPRCLWISLRRQRRPSGPIGSFYHAFDQITKQRFDRHRSQGQLPPELVDVMHPDAELVAQSAVNRLRNWKTAPRFRGVSGVTLSGALDDACWLPAPDGRRLLTPIDYKCSSTDNIDSSSVSPYYRAQLEAYRLLLEAALDDVTTTSTTDVDGDTVEVADHGYLVVYGDPEFRTSTRDDAGENAHTIDIRVKTVPVKTERSRIIDRLERAAEILKADTPPEFSSDCDYCAWAATNGG